MTNTKYCPACFETLRIDQFRATIRNNRTIYQQVCHECEVISRRKRYRREHGLPLYGDVRPVRQEQSDTDRICIGCKENLPVKSFMRTEKKDDVSVHLRCNACRRSQRRENEHKLRLAGRKPVRQFGQCKEHGNYKLGNGCQECRRLRNKVFHKKEKEKLKEIRAARSVAYTCKIAECDVSVPRRDMKCLTHANILSNYQQIAKDSDKLRDIQAKRMSVYGQSDKKCKGCKKLITLSGLCYECATGRKRTIVSIYERQSAGIALVS